MKYYFDAILTSINKPVVKKTCPLTSCKGKLKGHRWEKMCFEFEKIMLVITADRRQSKLTALLVKTTTWKTSDEYAQSNNSIFVVLRSEASM